MPCYYFDLRYDDEPWSNDPDGTELSGIDEARSEAVALMAGIVRDKLRKYWQIGSASETTSLRPFWPWHFQ